MHEWRGLTAGALEAGTKKPQGRSSHLTVQDLFSSLSTMKSMDDFIFFVNQNLTAKSLRPEFCPPPDRPVYFDS